MFLTTGISTLESLLSLFGVMILFCLILVLCYVVTRWLGSSGLLQQRNRNISIVESYKLGPNTYIQIVKIGKKYHALGTGKDTVEYLSEIEEEYLDLEQYKNLNQRGQNQENFKDILSKVSKKRCGD